MTCIATPGTLSGRPIGHEFCGVGFFVSLVGRGEALYDLVVGTLPLMKDKKALPEYQHRWDGFRLCRGDLL